MIHLIYIYFLVASVCFGYTIGDPFTEYNILFNFSRSIFWLPAALFILIKIPIVKLWSYDLIQIGLVHLGRNIYKGNENAAQIIEALEKQMFPVWSNWRTGKYYIQGVNKLKKMNAPII